MKKQKNSYKKWEPISGLVPEMYLEGLHHDYEGFRLLLKGSNKQDSMLCIAFDPVLTYRNIDEGDLLFYDRHDEDPKLGRWGFFTVDYSNYLEWFQNTSQGIYASKEIIHYAIYTPNDCLDILSAYPPKVEWLN